LERNLENYLTAQEKKKVDEIISRAMKRREENGWKEEQQPFQQPFEFVVINCQCQEAQEEQEVQDEKDNINQMLGRMCKCIRACGRCPREDEALPF
jgi:hypothetical protein